MDPIHTIVAAVDLSEASREVLTSARRLAEVLEARVEVVHVVYDLKKYMGFYVGCGSVKDLQENLQQEAVARLDELTRDVFAGRGDFEVRVLKGTPFADLVRFIRKVKGDLLVLGAHGINKPEHKIFGSTAERLIKNAPCPVLVVGQK